MITRSMMKMKAIINLENMTISLILSPGQERTVAKMRLTQSNHIVLDLDEFNKDSAKQAKERKPDDFKNVEIPHAVSPKSY